MTIRFLKFSTLFIFSAILNLHIAWGQIKNITQISGKLSLDDTWEPMIYLSHIPSFDDMYVMSTKMIIAEAEIDSSGYFEFNLDFLPKNENLYRLHIVKKNDTPATLIIGGRNENHLFLILNHSSKVFLKSSLKDPPFRNTIFERSKENIAFQQVSNLFFYSDSLASASSASKRMMIEKQLQNDLLLIADTSSNFLISLYAIYKSQFEYNYVENKDFYKSYVKKWKHQDNAYFKSFVKQLPNSNKTSMLIIASIILAVIILIIVVFFAQETIFSSNKRVETLSIQEKRVYNWLQQGCTNQEIANHLNIGLSTVKSHVSSIYSKLNIKSRKEIVNNNKKG